MNAGQFELAVAIPRDGKSIKIREYGHAGRTYVEGRPQQPFSVQFKNNSPSRVLAVVSIDGLDVVDGRPATAQSRGYVVPAYSSCEIKGWRTSLSDISRFVFQPKSGSYAAGKAGEANCGVIAAKVFAEKVQPVVYPVYVERVVEVPVPVRPWPYPWWPERIWYTSTSGIGSGVTYTGSSSLGSGSTTGDVPRGTDVRETLGRAGLIGAQYCCSVGNVSTGQLSAAAEAPKFNLGTGWGHTEHDSVSTTGFERAAELALLTVYYSDADGLRAAGIQLEKEIAVLAPASFPQPFGEFCQPPVG